MQDASRGVSKRIILRDKKIVGAVLNRSKAAGKSTYYYETQGE